jgi:glycosyltransferase involved in cell wall biosynthesis
MTPARARPDGQRGYLLLVEAPCFPLGSAHFAVESAFGEHLRLLSRLVSGRCERFVVMAPHMSQADYERAKAQLATLSSVDDGVTFEPLHPAGASSLEFWRRHAFAAARTIWRGVGRAAVVHAGVSHDFRKPTLFFAVLSATLRGSTTVFVVDIDNRESARMALASGRWSRKSYLLCKYVYDPIRSAQVRFAARTCDVVLLKGRELVRDYGRGRPNVHHFYDTVHAASDVLSDAELAQKLARIRRVDRPLRAVYFGRLTPYKGVDRTILAVHAAARRAGRPLELSVVGAGEQHAALRSLVAALGAERSVRFEPAMPYGKELFEHLRRCDVALATPLAEDTPRAAFDAMAMGLPIAAFDTRYYRDLVASGAVVVAPWPEVDRLAERLVELDRDRESLVTMTEHAVRFARANTQEHWLSRRLAWTFPAQPDT